MPDWAFHWIGYTLAVAAAIMIAWSFFADRARGRVRCRKCWYDLAEIGDLPITCPECGKAHTKPKHLKRTRRRKRLALIWLLVMLVGGYGIWVVPRLKAEGHHGLVPNFLLSHYVPHVNLRTVNQYPRLNAEISELFERWDSPDGRDGLRRSMRIWLAIGLVDPHGYYGDESLKTIQDLNNNLGNWTGAGGAFQDIIRMEDLPKWARWAAIERQINGFFIRVEPMSEGGDYSTIRVLGNARWDVQVGEMILMVRPREMPGSSGVTLVGDQSRIPTEADRMLVLSSDELDQMGWGVPVKNENATAFIPPPLAQLAASPSGTYPVQIRIIDGGELVGEFDIDFVLEPVNWRYPDLRYIKAVRTSRRNE